MKTNHTKGEWISKKSLNRTRTEVWVDGDIEPTFFIIHNETTSKESEANAKLITSATQLLDACIKAYGMITEAPLSAMDILEKAINKATK